MDARSLEAVAKDLELKRERAFAYCSVGTLALGLTVALATAVPVGRTLTGAAATTAAVAYALAALLLLSRRELIERLARDPSTLDLAPVRRFALRLGRAEWRVNAAHQILELVRGAHTPSSVRFYLRDRVASHSDELVEVAQALLSRETRFSRRSLVEVHSLLTCGAESPLYNPTVEPRALYASLLRIRAGISAQ